MSADVIDDPAVDLLGHALIEAAVAGLHVEDRNLLPLRGDGGEAAVGVAQDEDGVGPSCAEHRVDLGDDQADRLGGGLAPRHRGRGRAVESRDRRRKIWFSS